MLKLFPQIILIMCYMLMFNVTHSSASCGSMSRTLRQNLYSSVVSLSIEKDGRTEQGSGVIISSSGYIITNHHVVDDATQITVNVYSGENSRPTPRYRAVTVYTNSDIDVAVIQINRTNTGATIRASDLETTLTPISGYTSAELDDFIRIIGYPLIGGGTIINTQGNISGINTILLGNQRGNIFLTDATSNVGGSGGLVVNCSGIMIGILVRIREQQFSEIMPMDTICSIDNFICDEFFVFDDFPQNNLEFSNPQSRALSYTNLFDGLAFNDLTRPGTARYTRNINPSTTYRLSFEWCGGSRQNLQEILSPLTVEFWADGNQISGRNIYVASAFAKGRAYCQAWVTLIDNWPSDSNIVVEVRYTLSSNIYDQLTGDTYRAGEYVQSITVVPR